MIDLIIMMIEWMIVALGEEFIEECEGTWLESSTGYNPGQQTIFEQNIMPEIDSWLMDVADTWCWFIDPSGVSMSDYDDVFWSTYDPDVLERAFTETFERPYDRMEELLDHAQMLQSAIEAMDIFDF